MAQTVRRTPVDKERPFIKLSRGIGEVVQAEVRDLFAALTLLNLPSGNVYIDQKIRPRKDQGGSRPNGHHQSCFATTALHASRLETLGIEEILQFPRVHATKHRIIGEGGGKPLLQF